MKVVGLFSGGKDSTFAARKAQEAGNELKYLVTIKSENPDSYMFHTVNLDLTDLQAQVWGIPHIELETKGEKEKELMDLKEGLSNLEVEGLVSGAIASNYQRERLDRICTELGLIHISPLWGMDRELLIREMLDNGMKIIFSAVSAYGLDVNWLGEFLNEETLGNLVKLNRKIGLDICGEGGEYESLVVDAPWFNEKLEVKRAEKTWDGVSGRYIVKEVCLSCKHA
jgi:ABC transporter with metal-binding/Fe-S-binding domain ATP-binding protein